MGPEPLKERVPSAERDHETLSPQLPEEAEADFSDSMIVISLEKAAEASVMGTAAKAAQMINARTRFSIKKLLT